MSDTSRIRSSSGAPQFFVDDDGLRARDLEARPPTQRVEFLAMLPILAALLRAGGVVPLRFLLTTQLAGVLPIRGPDVVVICLNDEDSRVPAYSSECAFVFKTYGVTRPFLRQLRGPIEPAWLAGMLARELLVQRRRIPGVARRALAAARGGAVGLADLPLGSAAGLPESLTPFADRRLDVSWMGSLINQELTTRHSLRNPKARSRSELLAALAELDSDPAVAVEVVSRSSYHESHRFHDEYVATLGDTRIVPCPRGGRSLETYRFFEALAFGCVVVCEVLPERFYYNGAPVHIVRRWSQLPGLVRELLAAPEDLAATHAASLRWWEERCAPGVVASQMLEQLRR